MLNLITEQQSAEIAGVSPDTIRKYCEIGLLNPVEMDSGFYFKEDEIRSLFYTKKSLFFNSSQERPLATVSSTSPTMDSTTPPSTSKGNSEVENTFEATSLQNSSHNKAYSETNDEGIAEISKPISLTEILTSNPQTQEAKTEPQAQPIPTSPSPSTAEIENSSLKQQLEFLKEERDWLRRRVEQLELRSEREQMLLLSESETVRRLVNKEQKRTWALPFLNWFSETDQHKK